MFSWSGIEKTDKEYFVSQKTYAKKLLQRYGIGESKEKVTPMEPHLKLMKDEGRPLKNAKHFQQQVGSLIYLTIKRLNIAYSVGIVSQFMQSLRCSHLDAARKILHYVKGSIDHGLMYRRHKKIVLNGYTDTIGLEMRMIDIQFQDIILILVQLWYLGASRSNQW